MATTADLTDSSIYIPYNPDQPETPTTVPVDLPDIPNGPQLRLQAFRQAWTKCLRRVQATIRQFHEPVVADAIRHVRGAYEGELPGLPFAEMPAICLTGGSSLIHEITNSLEHPSTPEQDSSDDASSAPPSSESTEALAFVTHLFPTDKPNLMTCMKNLISGFLDKSVTGLIDSKRKATTSLASFDINLLQVWYDAVKRAYHPDKPPNLLVVLHDFEQFDPVTMQDLLYICSLHIPSLPLTFLISLSAPPSLSSIPISSSYLYQAYPRSTLSLLRIDTILVPGGKLVLNEILTKTFFDVDFEPDIVLGPAALGYLVDFWGRWYSGVDGLITVLHLTYLKHFEEPLTVLTHSNTSILPFVSPNSLPQALPFLTDVHTRLHAPNPNLPPSSTHSTSWLSTASSPQALLEVVDNARDAFKMKMRGMRVALGLLRMVDRFMIVNGYKGILVERERGHEVGPGDLEIAALKGQLEREAKWSGIHVRKLSKDKLRLLLDEMHNFFHQMPSHIRREQETARVKIIEVLSAVASSPSESAKKDAEDMGDWLNVYLHENLTSVEECKLWEIWYTGSTPFPSEMLNPSIRASIISGLLYPFDYINQARSQSVNQDETPPPLHQNPELWELPDTSILFRRYLDSGKMINVYDWFESFAVVLESQRRNRRQEQQTRLQAQGKGKMRESPRKGSKKKKEEEEEEEEEAEEKWKLEVRARFIRALHELDYLGFIKHTRRKRDHVLRTVFDIVD